MAKKSRATGAQTRPTRAEQEPARIPAAPAPVADHDLIEQDRRTLRERKPTRCPHSGLEELPFDEEKMQRGDYKRQRDERTLVIAQLHDAANNPIGYPQWMSRMRMRDLQAQQSSGLRYVEVQGGES